MSAATDCSECVAWKLLAEPTLLHLQFDISLRNCFVTEPSDFLGGSDCCLFIMKLCIYTLFFFFFLLRVKREVATNRFVNGCEMYEFALRVFYCSSSERLGSAAKQMLCDVACFL